MAEVFQVKGIKPKKLKVDAFRLELLNALRAEGRDVKKEYEKTTATWKRKPEFEVLIGLTGRDASVLVGTDDEVYGYVDQGTRPHVIRARNAPRLRFQSGYKAKTAPRRIESKAGGPFGPVVYAKQVMHPGTQAREFSQTIQGRRRRPFTRRMVKAMQKAGKNAF
jgi:hypothetical protein